MRVPVPSEVLAEAHAAVERHGRVALCQILTARGSTPGRAGWRLLVSPDGSTFGNLGGGAFEALVAAEARERLETGAPAFTTKRYYLTEEASRGEATGMACGGMMEVALEVLSARPRLVVVGGGPVGQAVARHAAPCDFEVVVADDRPEFRRPELFPQGVGVEAVGRDFDLEALSAAGRRAVYVAVVSRCWDTDAAALASVVERAPAGLEYVGLMGSRRKIDRVVEALAERGLSLDGLPFHAPIGIDLGGSTPDEIAISIVAQLVQVRSTLAAEGREGTDDVRSMEVL